MERLERELPPPVQYPEHSKGTPSLRQHSFAVVAPLNSSEDTMINFEMVKNM